MPVALHSYIIEKDRTVKVRHTFYAETEEEADELLKQHAANCPHFGPATAAGETVEIVTEIDELPDAEALEDFDEEDEPDFDEIDEEDAS